MVLYARITGRNPIWALDEVWRVTFKLNEDVWATINYEEGKVEDRTIFITSGDAESYSAPFLASTASNIAFYSYYMRLMLRLRAEYYVSTFISRLMMKLYAPTNETEIKMRKTYIPRATPRRGRSAESRLAYLGPTESMNVIVPTQLSSLI